jgi:hypothetical protein
MKPPIDQHEVEHHWIHDGAAARPMDWDHKLSVWYLTGQAISPEMAGRCGWIYLGPLTSKQCPFTPDLRWRQYA